MPALAGGIHLLTLHTLWKCNLLALWESSLLGDRLKCPVKKKGLNLLADLPFRVAYGFSSRNRES